MQQQQEELLNKLTPVTLDSYFFNEKKSSKVFDSEPQYHTVHTTSAKRFNDWPYGNNSAAYHVPDTRPDDSYSTYQSPDYNSVQIINNKFSKSTNNQILGTLIARQNCDIEELNDELNAYNQAWQIRMQFLQRCHREEQGKFLHHVQGPRYSMLTHHRKQQETEYFDFSPGHEADHRNTDSQRGTNHKPSCIK